MLLHKLKWRLNCFVDFYHYGFVDCPKNYFHSYRSGEFPFRESRRFSNTPSTNHSDKCKYHVAVIGSGPAGFYTSQQLLKHPNICVDIYEKFPVPFGLVRFGVAPDHQEVKNVINSFTKVAMNERTRFIGNINIGTDVTFQELRDAYHAVVLCYGSSKDALLNIPGEDLANVISARRFVGWYNGIPQDKDLQVDLDTETAVIVGQGNVALDCARILLTPLETLKKTDITRHAWEKLQTSQVRKVNIVGRRGPLQAAFKIKEFRELTKIDDCHVKFDWPDWIKNRLDFSPQLIKSLPRSKKRIAELYKKIIDESGVQKDTSKECIFKFFLSPIEIRSNNNPIKPRVRSVVFKINHLDDYIREDAKIINISDGENDLEEIECGILIRSIGYKAEPIDPSLPFDQKRGVILNEAGRVNENVGLYCSGWAAFGASGVILNTMNASFEVGKNIVKDFQEGLLDFSDSTKKGYAQIQPLLVERNANIVDFIDWQRIDQYEKELGQKEGKPREKIVSVDEILDVKEKKNND